MQYIHLNVDILYEIFGYFVAVDQDGPFTLILVCTQWQHLAVKYPPLWSWIYVDDRIEDWRYRTKISVALAGDCPLQCVIHLPFGSVRAEDIQPYVSRTKVFIVVMPSVMEVKKGFGYIKRFFDLLGHAGEIYIHWVHGAQFNPLNELDVISSNEVLENILSTHSQNAVENLRIDVKPKVTLNQLNSMISRVNLLTRLVVFARCIDYRRVDDQRRDYIAPIHMALLRILVVVIGDASEAAIRLLQSCVAPNISLLTLEGTIENVPKVIERLGHILQAPEMKLILAFNGPKSSIIQSISLPTPLTSPSRLIVAVVSSDRLEETAIKAMRNLIAYLPAPSLKLEIDDNSCDLLSYFAHSNQFIKLEYSGSCSRRDQFQDQLRSHQEADGTSSQSPSSPRLIIDSILIPYSQDYPHSYPVSIIPFVRRVYLMKSVTVLDLLSLIQNLPLVEELEVCDLLLQPDEDLERILENYKGKVSPLQSLVFLKSSPLLVSTLVHMNLLPKLQILSLYHRLSRSYEEYYSHFEKFVEIITKLDTRSLPRCPAFRAIRAPQYLPWKALFKLAQFSTKRLVHPDGFMIQLPSLPYPSILFPLVSILRGEQPAYDGSFPTWISRTEYNAMSLDAMVGCYQCHIGGWRCKTLNYPTCWRHKFETWSSSSWWCHGIRNLVEINKYTLNDLGMVRYPRILATGTNALDREKRYRFMTQLRSIPRYLGTHEPTNVFPEVTAITKS